MNLQFIAEFIVCLAGMFGALLWLRPGKSEAARYAVILLAVGALYALAMMDALGWRYYVLQHVRYSAPVILYLLGAYMLKCPWRRVVLSFGIYSLLCTAVGIVQVFRDMYPDILLPSEYSRDVIIDYAYVWLFIWLCARKSGKAGKWTALLAAGAYYTLSGVVMANLRNGLVLGEWGSWLRIVVNLLSFIFMLYWVLQQTRKRSVITTVLFILPTVLAELLLWVYRLP